MKALLRRIRQILRDRKTSRIFSRFVSTVAAIVVFVTTYALVLPAITMEAEAQCGIEAHQHDDSCYEEVLECDIPEDSGHTHDESCYETKQILTCRIDEHQHDSDCYDENGELICGETEHQHGEECFKKDREFVCGIPESTGHTHDASCYKKVLTCGREVHVHSAACYHNSNNSGTVEGTTAENAAVVSTESAAIAVSESSSMTTTPLTDTLSEGIDSEAGTAAYTGTAYDKTTEGYVPVLEELYMPGNLDKETGIYFSRLTDTDSDSIDAASSEDETAGADADTTDYELTGSDKASADYETTNLDKALAENGAIAEWNRVDVHTELGRNDLLRVYLSYTIPAGALNATNSVACYRLPAAIRLTDEQVENINKTTNGIANQYVNLDTLEILDYDRYQAALGIEAVEGDRTPDQNVQEYLENHGGQEFISATVKVENVFDEDTGAFSGQDLVFSFTPYTISKNQHEYDADGQPTKAGEEVSGWIAFDVTTEQVEWSQTDDGSQTAQIVFAEKNRENKIDEISTELRLVNNTTNDTSDADVHTKKSDAADANDSVKDSRPERAANGKNSQANETRVNHPAVSFDDSIKVSAGTLSTDTVDAESEKTEIKVHVEADEDTFPEGTVMHLEKVSEDQLDAVAEAVEGAMSGASDGSGTHTQGFHAVDISFWNSDGVEIQPLKPIRVSITSESIRRAVEDDSAAPVVVHVEDKDEADASSDSVATVIETKTNAPANNGEKSAQGKKNEEEGTLEFTSDSFSVYAIVYTVDFHWEVDGKEYSCSIPGGGYMSFSKLMEAIGVAKGDSQEAKSDDQDQDDQGKEELSIDDLIVSEETRQFVTDVDKMEFSSPKLISISKAEEDTSVGAIKDGLGLECEYSEELTEEDIARINETQVEGGDWILISLIPFNTEESLTVTMKDRESFQVKVTDAQPSWNDLDGKTFLLIAQGTNLAVTSDLTNGSLAPASKDTTNSKQMWVLEHTVLNGTNYGWYKSKSVAEGKYIQVANNNSISFTDQANNATVFYIDKEGDVYSVGLDYNNSYNDTNGNHKYLALCNNTYGQYVAVEPMDNINYWNGQQGCSENKWFSLEEVQLTSSDPVGDWMLYFDDDFSDITIHVGETISLRPYNKWEWKEGSTDVQSYHWNIGGKDNNFWNQIDQYDDNGAHNSAWDDGGTGSNTAVFHWTVYVKKDTELVTHYWAVQGRATQTGDYTLTNTKNGKTITVHVVDGPPVNQPKTINKVANIKVNLFDYDRTGMLDGSWNNNTQWWNDDNLANQANNYKNDSVNKMGGSDHFYFLSSGGGNNSGESWNSYSHASANPNIVKNELDSEGYPVLNHGNNTSLKYLFDTSQASKSDMAWRQ